MKFDRRREIPERLRDADDAITHLSRVLRKKKSIAPNSLRDQLTKSLRHSVRMSLRGEDRIYPGMEKMAQWGGVKKRQARYNFDRLENLRIYEVVANKNGGSGLAAEFVVNLRALKIWLVRSGFNPSKELLSKLEYLETFEICTQRHPVIADTKKAALETDQKAAKNEALIAARSSSINGKPVSSSSNVVSFNAQDGGQDD